MTFITKKPKITAISQGIFTEDVLGSARLLLAFKLSESLASMAVGPRKALERLLHQTAVAVHTCVAIRPVDAFCPALAGWLSGTPMTKPGAQGLTAIKGSRLQEPGMRYAQNYMLVYLDTMGQDSVSEVYQQYCELGLEGLLNAEAQALVIPAEAVSLELPYGSGYNAYEKPLQRYLNEGAVLLNQHTGISIWGWSRVDLIDYSSKGLSAGVSMTGPGSLELLTAIRSDRGPCKLLEPSTYSRLVACVLEPVVPSISARDFLLERYCSWPLIELGVSEDSCRGLPVKTPMSLLAGFAVSKSHLIRGEDSAVVISALEDVLVCLAMQRRSVLCIGDQLIESPLLELIGFANTKLGAHTSKGFPGFAQLGIYEQFELLQAALPERLPVEIVCQFENPDDLTAVETLPKLAEKVLGLAAVVYEGVIPTKLFDSLSWLARQQEYAQPVEVGSLQQLSWSGCSQDDIDIGRYIEQMAIQWARTTGGVVVLNTLHSGLTARAVEAIQLDFEEAGIGLILAGLRSSWLTPLCGQAVIDARNKKGLICINGLEYQLIQDPFTEALKEYSGVSVSDT